MHILRLANFYKAYKLTRGKNSWKNLDNIAKILRKREIGVNIYGNVEKMREN